MASPGKKAFALRIDPGLWAEVERLARRATGDDRDRRDLDGELDQHVGGLGVDVGLAGIVDDRRQGAVEVQPDHGPVRGADDRVVPLLTLR